MARAVAINRHRVALLDKVYLINMYSDTAKTHTCQPSVMNYVIWHVWSLKINVALLY